MPALPVVPGVIAAVLQWEITGKTGIGTKLFFEYSGGPPNSGNCASLADAIVTAAGAMNGLWADEVSLVGCKVTDLSSSSGGVGEQTAAQAGTLTTEILTAASAVVASYAITRRYRGGKPRNYWPFGGSAQLSTGQAWSDTFINSVATDLATFFSAVVGTSAGSTTITNHCNVSYYDGFTVVTNPTTGRARNVPKLRAAPVVDAIVGTVVSAKPGSQRRRN